jgi:hypothetical protein
MNNLKPIEYIDLGGDSYSGLATSKNAETVALYSMAKRFLTKPILYLCDKISKSWADRRTIPYREEIDAIDATIAYPGAYFANLNFEWGCTSAALDTPQQSPTLARCLDWPFPDMGWMAKVVRKDGKAGDYYNITWPGFVGVIQAMAPGRFAISINNAPKQSFGTGPIIGWPLAKYRVWKAKGTPPTLLLRQVFENCHSYDEAVQVLSQTPITTPVIFFIVGTSHDQVTVIEKTQTRTVIHNKRAATNHWQSDLKGSFSFYKSKPRLASITKDLNSGNNLEWLKKPVLNKFTRIVAEMNPALGSLVIQGYENQKPVTHRFTLK